MFRLNNDQINIFVNLKDKSFIRNNKNYFDDNQIQFQINFNNWLVKTFKISVKKLNDLKFKDLIIKKKMKLLLLGCGLGDEIFYLEKKYKKYKIDFYYQDLSLLAAKYAKKKLDKKKINCKFVVSKSDKLPFKNNYFDACFHFGGINLFDKSKNSVEEFFRVTKNKGQIIYGDEGIGDWLRKSTYSKMLINNNKLWAAESLTKILPYKANNVKTSWILENCFYIVSAIKDSNFPKINYKIRHKSPRGGSIYSRYKKLTKNKKK